MKISRRPKSRASSENAPGPKKRIAVAVVSTFKIASLLSSRFAVGAGIQASAYAIVPDTTRRLVRGVRIPARKHTPPESANAAATAVSNLRLLQSLR